jgi:hypothetical protein
MPMMVFLPPPRLCSAPSPTRRQQKGKQQKSRSEKYERFMRSLKKKKWKISKGRSVKTPREAKGAR